MLSNFLNITKVVSSGAGILTLEPLLLKSMLTAPYYIGDSKIIYDLMKSR